MAVVEFKGKMPNPFVKDDGTKVTPDEWKEYKSIMVGYNFQ